MIFYFSGTGNTKYVALKLANILHESAQNISEMIQQTFSTSKIDQRLILITPVHSWGPAIPVFNFIQKIPVETYRNSSIYLIGCCGDECGLTHKIVEEQLRNKGLSLKDSYSIQMPNNYIILPGFDVDSKQLEKKKLEKANQKIQLIAEAIQKNLTTNSIYYEKGSFSKLKSRLIYPIFKSYFTKKIKFYATDACVGCGLCAKICPEQCISIPSKGEAPIWNKKSKCVQCLACIHRCPQRAIEYGNATQKKGRYKHPDL